MQPYSVEQSIIEGEMEVKELFEYVQNKAAQFEAYEMEKSVFAKVMQIGLAAMKCYFAEKGTGDIGAKLQLENGKILKKEPLAETSICIRNNCCIRLSVSYFELFGQLFLNFTKFCRFQRIVIPLTLLGV